MSSTQFQGKVIAVTGAASGIGFATASLLAERGASLSLADVQSEALEKAKETILTKVPSAKIITYTIDVRKADQVEAWVAETTSKLGRLDGAANIAGVVPKSIGSDAGLVENIDAGEWDFTMDINARGVMHCMKYQLRALGEGGSLVNAASVAGLVGRERNGIYTASKHAVVGLSRAAAKEVGRRGIRVNCFCP
jgi:NAD(P)-dependent dehydrogenase (short-subunit alcohol dehydrogenase family)